MEYFEELKVFANRLGLSEKVVNGADEILQKKSEALNQWNKKGLILGALYLSATLNGEKRTQRQIATACDFSEMSVRKWYRFLLNKRG
jgi:transcription initiation factor TFIIB